MRNTIVILFAMSIFVGCDHAPLNFKSVHEAGTVTNNPVLTSEAPTPTATANVVDTSTATATVTSTSTEVDASVDNSMKTETTTATTTATVTTTTVAKAPIIALVTLENVDAQGKAIEDTRRFVIEFNGPAKDIRLKVSETLTGAVLVDSPVIANGVQGEKLKVNMDKKLKSDTTYNYMVSAVSADGKFVNSSWTGDFKTVYCFIGEWKYHYTPDSATDGIGKCRGAMMQCVDNGHGGGMLSGAGEYTPYPWGDICGNNIDDDCDGIIDNSPTIVIPSGQDTLWSKTGTDGEVLRFNVKTGLGVKTRISQMTFEVEGKGVNLGYFHLWMVGANSGWKEIVPVKFYDATSNGYQPDKADLGKGFYNGTSSKYTLGLSLPNYGMDIDANTEIQFMLVALPDLQSRLSGTSVRVSNPKTDASCPAIGGKTITIE